MRIGKINNTNFKAGEIGLKNIDSKNLKTLESIKKLAEDYGIDIYIYKSSDQYHLPSNDFYAAFAINPKYYIGSSCAITRKNMNATEASVNIFNMVIRAIENLNKKAKNKFNKKAFIK